MQSSSPNAERRTAHAAAAGRRYVVPCDVRDALERVFEEPRLDRVEIVYRPWYVVGHLAWIGGSVGSVTRPGRIYTNIPEAVFFRLDLHVLHEYYHVVQQWGRERMTRIGYLLDAGRREREAREFAAANLERYRHLRSSVRRSRIGRGITPTT